ncbi:MAG: protein-L-isoaspartate(D-aspartate) O-methyltransferase [Candidatus Aerophobetes bacterium]|nr:protein-L-isoaspartate(D-aspartate) O-methyltransferase [Candidatus Aerophobetes bacterium]
MKITLRRAGIILLVAGIGGGIFFLISFYRVEEESFKNPREEMVKEQIQKRGIKDEKVIRAMIKVPRHKFVAEHLKPHAYEDTPLPIGMGQTISQPYIVALMTELLQLKKEDKALEVGTGSGYQAAVLAEIVNEVYTVEIIEKLGTRARERLKELDYNKVQVKIDDGYYGWKEYAPYDAIIVTCAAEHVPPPLIRQLKEEGRMCIPVGGPFQVQTLMLIEKKGEKIISRSILPVRFVPMLRKH